MKSVITRTREGHLGTELDDEVAQSEDATVPPDLVIDTRAQRAGEAMIVIRIVIRIAIRIVVALDPNVRNGLIEVVTARQVPTNPRGIPVTVVVVVVVVVTNDFKICPQRNLAFSHNRQG